MNNKNTNYTFWDDQKLISGFNMKDSSSFFKSETELLKHISVTDLKSVLDIGCSCGRFVELLAENRFDGHFEGVDISAPSIELCKKNYPQYCFKTANALTLEGKSRFELVNATGVVQHEARYPELIEKMVSLSSKYILFDVKLAPVESPVVDITRSFCQVGDEKIHMVVFSVEQLLKQLQAIPSVGSVRLYGYSTPPNEETTRPSEITEWASCGVLIEKGSSFKLLSSDLPGFLS